MSLLAVEEQMWGVNPEDVMLFEEADEMESPDDAATSVWAYVEQSITPNR
jgi:hypothetical protein